MPARQHVAPFGDQSAPAAWPLPAALEVTPLTAYASMDGSGATSAWCPCLRIISDSGHVVAEAVSPVAVAAGGSADVSWFPDVEQDAADTSASGAIIDSFFVDTRSPTGATSAVTLEAGTDYLVTATGTWSYVNHSLDTGSPEAHALYPTPGARASTQVGSDPETTFAYYSASGGAIGHWTLWQFDLGSGFAYVTPTDGTHAAPNASHSYDYQVTGEGSPLAAKFADSPTQYGDNYGYVLVTIRTLGPTGLPGAGPDHAILRSSGGIAVWESRPDIDAADLSMLDGNAAHYLDGTGAMTTPPSSGVTSIDSLTGALTLIAGANIAITDNSPAAGDIKITASGSGVNNELDYVEKTTSVTVTATSDATATAILDGNAVSYNGATRIKLEFWCMSVNLVTNQNIVVNLYDGATDLGRIGIMTNPNATANQTGDFGPLYCVRFLTPSNASHTFHIKGWKANAAGGSPVVAGGAGGTATTLPMWYRITTA